MIFEFVRNEYQKSTTIKQQWKCEKNIFTFAWNAKILIRNGNSSKCKDILTAFKLIEGIILKQI